MNTKTFFSREAYVLANNDRHNPCPHCGGEAIMTFHGDNECHAVCPHCSNLNIRFAYAEGYADSVKNTCRRPYNMLALWEEYSRVALETIKIKDGEYAVVDDQDGYICCVGDEIAATQYIAAAIDRDHGEFYHIYRLADNEFYYVGTSNMIAAVLMYKHAK